LQVAIQPPQKLEPIELPARGRIRNRSAWAMVSNLPLSIARRELKIVAETLKWDSDSLKAAVIKKAKGPGNILTLEIESENLTEVFSGFGQRGVSAEKVALRAIKMVQEYLANDLPVGRYLADQLLIPMAMAGGGKFRTLSPSRHTTTNIAIIKQFLEVDIRLKEIGVNQFEIEINHYR
jgi:RNA 3'-terminal phosphate cyclase (ATP)